MMKLNTKFISGACFGLILCLNCASSAQAETLARWPVEFTNPANSLSSAFGPRLKASDDYRYDFHRGIDLPGKITDRVVAAQLGSIFKLYSADDPNSAYPNGGNVVIIKHQFDNAYDFHGSQTYYYTLYMHLDSFNPNLEAGDSVQAGDWLGQIGQTGDTTFNHLHFEVRVGTTCSLESSCSKGYDPHINPLTFLPYPQNNKISARATIYGSDLNLYLKIPRAELDFNKAVLITYDKQGNQVTKQTLDFNERLGIDATSTAALDNPLYQNILLSPSQFNSNSPTEKITVSFLNAIDTTIRKARLKVYDATGTLLATKTIKL